jgi:hypothetical protein
MNSALFCYDHLYMGPYMGPYRKDMLTSKKGGRSPYH